MATEIFIREAPEAAEIAAELIPDHHPHLRRARILFLFTTQKRRKCDKVKLASAAKMSALQRYLSSGTEASVQAGFDFIMLIGNEEWGFLPTEGRRALVDHELCFPAGVQVAGPAVEGSLARWYAGQLVEIRTAAGHFLAGTPNHPVLTSRGWVPLGRLQVGDDVVRCADPERVAATVDPHEYQAPARIEEVARAGLVPLRFVPETAEDLDADSAHREVDVIAADRDLLARLVTAGPQHLSERDLGGRGAGSVGLARAREFGDRFLGVMPAAPGSMGGRELGEMLVTAEAAHPVALPVGAGSDGDARAPQDPPNGARVGLPLLGEREAGCARLVVGNDALAIDVGAPGRHLVDALAVRFQGRAGRSAGVAQDTDDGGGGDADALRDRLQTSPGGVALDHVIRVDVRAFRGHVYNLQTAQQWYIANGLVVHNCHMGERVKLTRRGDEKRAWSVLGHDVEEFQAVIERHGLWRREVRQFAHAARQLPLDDAPSAPSREPAGVGA